MKAKVSKQELTYTNETPVFISIRSDQGSIEFEGHMLEELSVDLRQLRIESKPFSFSGTITDENTIKQIKSLFNLADNGTGTH